MRLELKATPRELAVKSEQLITELASLLEDVAPNTAEMLSKALPPKEVTLRYPVLHDLHKQTSALYQAHMSEMIAKIHKVLDRSLPKEK